MADCVALAHEGRLVLVVRRFRPVQRAELVNHLAQRLSLEMVPDTVVFSGEIPLTANGKVDRDRVAAELPEHLRADAGTHGEQSVLEAVTDTWRQVLGGGELASTPRSSPPAARR
ncbi:hypothetical protein [Kutzneria kofuensis]|uniref:hypothetical protein n=1 Tax=Kutzneria kofuensis TaxID=103725 RepID=UPI003CD0BDE6